MKDRKIDRVGPLRPNRAFVSCVEEKSGVDQLFVAVLLLLFSNEIAFFVV